MDRGAWRATVHGVTKSRTQLNTHIHIYRFKGCMSQKSVCIPFFFSSSECCIKLITQSIECIARPTGVWQYLKLQCDSFVTCCLPCAKKLSCTTTDTSRIGFSVYLLNLNAKLYSYLFHLDSLLYRHMICLQIKNLGEG